MSAHDRPLPGIEVALVDAAGRPGARTVTSAAGRFRFDAAPVGRFTVRARGAGFAASSVPVILVPGETVTAVIRLEPLELLEGVVRDQAGKPVANAQLFAWPAGAGRAQVVEARSGIDGRFALAGVSRGAWSLLAEAPGFGALRLERVDVPARDVVFKLEGEARTLGGQVVDERGAAAEGALVLLGGADVGQPREATTNSKGVFVFHGLGLGRYVLRAIGGRTASRALAVGIEADVAWVAPLRLTLQAAVRVTGRVLDDRGLPLGSASVEVSALPPDEAPLVGATDAKGGFAIGPLPAGLYQIIARGPGHAPAFEPELRLGRTDAVLDLRAQRSAHLQGLVRDPAGRPLAGARVNVAQPRAAERLLVLPGVLPAASLASSSAAASSPGLGAVATARADARGRFVFDELVPGSYHLVIEALGHLLFERDLEALAPGAHRDLGVIELRAGVLVTGRVLTEQGEPLVGARVEAATEGEPRAVQSAVATSDEAGGFSLRVPPGLVGVSARVPGRVPALRPSLRCELGKVLAPIELRLAPAAATLEGRVVSPGGRPLREAVVVAELVAAQGRPGLALATAMTDRAGHFKFTGLPAGPLALDVRHPDWPPRRVPVNTGTTATIELERPGWVEGEVRDAVTGSFISGAHVVGRGPEGRAAEDVRVRGAAFELRTLAPGRWTIGASAAGYRAAEVLVDVPSAARKGTPSVGNVRVALQRVEPAPAPGATRPGVASPGAGAR
jgi:protocatechuate 3,4-dioxygenase beta subunit